MPSAKRRKIYRPKRASRSAQGPRRIHLSCAAATSPGGSWHATLDFIPDARGVEIRGTHDTCDAPPRPMGRLRGRWDLRKIARWLADNQESYNGGDFVEDTKVRGVHGLWAEVLALAWNHEDGDPKNDLVLSLLELSDAQLLALRRWAGALTSPEARRRIDSMFELEEMGLQRTTLLSLVTTVDGRRSLEGLQASLAAAGTREEEQARFDLEQARRDRREAEVNYHRLRPAIAEALRRAEQIPEYQQRLEALSYWVHHRVRMTGRLPQGVFDVGRIQYKFNGIYDVGRVDCDVLFPIADDGSLAPSE